MNMDITQSDSGGVTVTPPAKEKIAELLSGADQSQSAVRVFVSGGGCGSKCSSAEKTAEAAVTA